MRSTNEKKLQECSLKLQKAGAKKIRKLIPGHELDMGGHDEEDKAVCLMEAVAFITGEPHSDHPRCVDPVLTEIGIEFNDTDSDGDRQKLIGAIPWLIGSRTKSKRVRWKRALVLCRSMLDRYLEQLDVEGEVAQAVVDALQKVSGLKSQEQAKKAAELMGFLARDADHHVVAEALQNLIRNWSPTGISEKKYKYAFEHLHITDGDLFESGEHQAQLLKTLGDIRS